MTSARTRIVVGLIAVTAVIAAGWYLYDPPWVAGVTSGLRDWEEDPPGTRFRWSAGRASFFVPSAATEVTLPLRAVFPDVSSRGKPVIVGIGVDGRWLADIALDRPEAWSYPTLPLPRRETLRRYRRVDLRVSRTVGMLNLGVQVGEARLR